MGLMKKLFRGGDDGKPPGPGGSSMLFQESQTQTSLEKTKSRNAPRRELVKVVLRETMRKHGIPTDWMDCRSLSVLTKQHKSGMHVQFLVLKGDHQLLQWVHAFQESFWNQILRTDPGANEWLFSVGWEFYGQSVQGFDVMPGPGSWKNEGPITQIMEEDEPQRPGDPGDTLPPEEADEHDQLATDLQALQSAMSVPAELVDLPAAAPRKHKP
ncbi:MAG TPA: hypothetical protein VMZ74_02820 [Ramlibacter sp.]|nr:hypothetical protein [Ramlibacter sp.]